MIAEGEVTDRLKVKERGRIEDMERQGKRYNGHERENGGQGGRLQERKVKDQ